MKRKDKEELRKASLEELTKKAKDLNKQITEERLAIQTKEVKNKHRAKELRRRLAVVLSLIRIHELANRATR
jgi:ribosomal protein L29